MALHDVLVRVGADTSNYTQGMDRAAGKLSAFASLAVSGLNSVAIAASSSGDTVNTRVGRMNDRMLAFGATATASAASVTGAFAAITVGVGAGIGALVNHAATFESAFAGVRKTVDASEEQFTMLSRAIREMSLELPASAAEIAGVAEVAGQLGVEVDNIEEFTRVMIMMGTATTLSSEDAAMAMARFMNIMGTSHDDVERLGSTIVELGNNLAATEDEIVRLGMRLAGAGKQVGMTEADVLAMAGTLASLGLNVEAAGTAFSRVMLTINSAIISGSEELSEFARVAGMSVSEFTEAFEKDPARAIEAFVAGIKRIGDEGEDTVSVLKSLELGEIRVRDALLRASEGIDIMGKSLDLASNAWEENVALTNEAEERYKTFHSQMTILGNKLSYVAQVIGSLLMEELAGFFALLGKGADVLVTIAQKIEDGDEALGRWIARLIIAIPILTGFITIVAAAVMTFFAFYTGLVAVASILEISAFAVLFLAAKVALVTSIIIAAIAAVTTLGVVVYQKWDEISAATSRMADTVTDAFERFMAIVTDTELTVSEKIEILTRGIRESFSDVARIVAEKAGEIKNAILEIIPDPVLSVIEQGAEKLKEIFNDVVDYISDIFSGDIEKIGEVFAHIIPAIIGYLIGGIPGILIAASRYMPAIADQFLQDSDQLIDSGIQALEKFLEGFVRNFSEIVEKGAEIIPKILEGIVIAIPLIIEGAATVLTAFVNGLTTYLPIILEAAVEIVTTLVQGIAVGLPVLIFAIMELVDAVIQTILILLPEILLVGVEILLMLVQGIVETIPILLEAIIQLIAVLIEAIIELLPEILIAGAEILLALIEGIVEVLPDLIEAVVQLILTIVEVVSENLPLIIEAGIQVLLSLIAGILRVLPSLLGTALLLIVRIVEVIITNLPKIISAGIEILLALVSGILSVAWELIQAAYDLLSDFLLEIASFITDLIDAGVDLMFALIEGILDTLSDVVSAAKDIGDGIIDKLDDFVSSAWDIGTDIINGLIGGMQNLAQSAWDKAKEVGNGIVDTFKGLFKTASPSKLMRDEIGKMIPLGIVDGMDAEIPALMRMAQAVTLAATPEAPKLASLDVGDFQRQASEVSTRLSAEVSDFNVERENEDSGVLREIRDELRKQKQTIIEMDKHVVGKVIEPEVSYRQGRKERRHKAFRK